MNADTVATQLPDLRVPSNAAIKRVAKEALHQLARPTLNELFHRTNFYWTPDDTRSLLHRVNAEVQAGRPQTAASEAITSETHNIEAHIAAMIAAQQLKDDGKREEAFKRADASIQSLHIAGKECIDRANPSLAVSLLMRVDALPLANEQVVADIVSIAQPRDAYVLNRPLI
jgi:hypothetical protein